MPCLYIRQGAWRPAWRQHSFYRSANQRAAFSGDGVFKPFLLPFLHSFCVTFRTIVSQLLTEFFNLFLFQLMSYNVFCKSFMYYTFYNLDLAIHRGLIDSMLKQHSAFNTIYVFRLSFQNHHTLQKRDISGLERSLK